MIGKYYYKYISILIKRMHDTFEVPEFRGFKIILAKIYIFLFGIPEIGLCLRMNYFQKALRRYNTNKFEYILDAGCGLGIFSFYLADRFPSSIIESCDINSEDIKLNKEILSIKKYPNLYFFQKNLLEFSEIKKYDLIICFDVLEHIENVLQIIHNFKISLKPNGLLFIQVPQKNQKIHFKKLENWAFKDHKRIGFSETELKSLLEDNGLKVIEIINTFGFFGSFSRQLNQITMSNFLLGGIIFPVLLLISRLDTLFTHKYGNGILVVASMREYEESI